MTGSALQTILEEHFRWLHSHPELSTAEFETTAYLRAALEAASIDVLNTGLATGIVARLNGGQPGQCVALRADIDALSIHEASGLEYASCNIGVMHACGHDFHSAALIGAALLLKERRQKLQGDVVLVFQPAEEASGGAATVLKTGVLDEVREIYGLHVAPNYPSGVVALKAGGTFAAVLAFNIKITGTGGHAALPHQSRDPITATAALITSAQSIVSRNCDPFDAVVLSFTHIAAGTTWNVIPGEALIEGTIRALSVEKAQFVADRLCELCAGIKLTHNLDAAINWWMDAPATNNNRDLTRFAAETAQGLGLNVTEYTPTMAGEDFALYQQKIPGVFINFGVDSPHGLHHPAFNAHTTHLGSAAELLAALAEKALIRLAKTDALEPV
ncbi:MAG: amidohydrolase [Spirochaetaceae bacterium]|jgi:amidohydrolase|nr:amidohydrolase [Spirochaetaceae bacterium]